jgi:hypothetical protein
MLRVRARPHEPLECSVSSRVESEHAPIGDLVTAFIDSDEASEYALCHVGD